jgi:hypothetical protein
MQLSLMPEAGRARMARRTWQNFCKKKEHKACQKNYFDISCFISSIILLNILVGDPMQKPRGDYFQHLCIKMLQKKCATLRTRTNKI